MGNSNLYGVELDPITGRIAQQLYPHTDIQVMGYEKTNIPDNFFDVAIGNIPFGSYKILDQKYDKHNFQIHDYFWAKSLDQVRPGGIVAFVTSKGTLDKSNPEVRKYLAQRADLLGAVHLPNNAFLKNAGTQVTSDIIFLQKRDSLRTTDEPDWVHLGKTEDGIPVNKYFTDNPHMILGKMSYESGTRMYGNESIASCIPIEGADLAEQLKTALSHVQGKITAREAEDIQGTQDNSIPADSTVRNHSYTIIDNNIYFRENSRMYPVDKSAVVIERIRGMTELRDTVRELIDYQLYDHPDHAIKAKQAELNTLYDKFTKKHGLINSSANKKVFQADSAYYLLCSLEKLDDSGKLESKSDMFSKRTIRQRKIVTSVEKSSEALAVSIGQKAKVDIGFMQALTGFTKEKIVADLHGVIFQIPDSSNNDIGSAVYVTANEYLSGNVREKLEIARQAAETSPHFEINVNALEQVQPKKLDASEISVRLGSTWIDKKYIQQFMYETLQTPENLQNIISVDYSKLTGEWNISGKTMPSSTDVLAHVTFGTKRINAYKIIEDSLNLKDVIDLEGTKKYHARKGDSYAICEV